MRGSNSSTVVTTFGDLQIHSLPSGKPVSVTKVIRADSKTVFVGADGKLYANFVRPGCFFGLGEYGFTETLMNALHKIGIATKEQAEEHKRTVSARKKTEAAKFDLERLTEITKEYGIKISSRELAKIENAAKGSRP